MKKQSVAIIGAGKVGSILGISLQKKGYNICAVASLSKESAIRLAELLNCLALSNEEATEQAELVFITTPDRKIATVSAAIAEKGGFHPGQIVAHTSGAHSAAELMGVREAGALSMSIHPLQSIAEIEVAIDNLPGSYFALEGDEDAMPLARQIVNDLGGKWFTISAADKPIYHAAACIAANYLVSLMHFATGLFGQFGLSPNEAFRALYPLVQGAITNIAEGGTVRALTGPISRGDSATVASHIKALSALDPEIRELYSMLGQYTVKVALEKKSIDESQGKELLTILKP